ncbi:MAG TPA: OB-fold domain-containing protein [Acidimicrobiia bacterium]|nr:OB-fold domain-containing protein [Acidimicrobiia bacterium]
MSPKPQVPEVEGWFGEDALGPHLIGTRCRACGSYFFPKETFACRNPRCGSSDLDDVPLSRRGKVWSFTTNEYAPPPPYPAREPFEPYTVVAVELPEERMIVLGHLARGARPSELHVGDQVEVVVEPFYDTDDATHTVWKWRPVT